MIEEAKVEILLIEDNPDHVELVRHVMEENKIANRIKVIDNGAEAINYLHAREEYSDRDIVNDAPKIILLDLKLPLVDGKEVLRQVKNDERTRSIPVIIMTSSREDQDLIDSYNLGVNSYIVKPVDFEQFSDSMREIGIYWLLLNQSPT